MTGHPLDRSADETALVQLAQFLLEGANGFSPKARQNPLQSRVFVRMQIDDVPARRENRVLQALEVLPHVVDDRLDEVACGESRQHGITVAPGLKYSL